MVEEVYVPGDVERLGGWRRWGIRMLKEMTEEEEEEDAFVMKEAAASVRRRRRWLLQ